MFTNDKFCPCQCGLLTELLETGQALRTLAPHQEWGTAEAWILPAAEPEEQLVPQRRVSQPWQGSGKGEGGGTVVLRFQQGKAYSKRKDQKTKHPRHSCARGFIQIQTRGWTQTANQQGILMEALRGLHPVSGASCGRKVERMAHMGQWGLQE